jgi:hypothetical protein
VSDDLSPLPEGTHVEIRLADSSIGIPEDLRAEFEEWDRASGDALELVERLARDGEADAHQQVDSLLANRICWKSTLRHQ